MYMLNIVHYVEIELDLPHYFGMSVIGCIKCKYRCEPLLGYGIFFSDYTQMLKLHFYPGCHYSLDNLLVHVSLALWVGTANVKCTLLALLIFLTY